MAQRIISSIKAIGMQQIIQRMLGGAAVGLLIVTLLVFSAGHPKPEWREWWMLRPMAITPIATAFGSLAFFSLNIFRPKERWKKMAVLLLSTLVFMITLWTGIILGLDGTLWDLITRRIFTPVQPAYLQCA